jgi:PAS domain S-box-containing protein
VIVAALLELLKATGDTVGHVWPLFVLVGALVGGLRQLWRLVRAELRAAIRAETEPILKEVTPNGGGSLKDAVKRTESKVDSMGVDVAHAISLASTNGARLSAVVANLQAAYYEMDADGNVTSVNDAYLELFGLSHAEALAGEAWRKFVDDDDLEAIDRSGARAMEAHTEWYSTFTVCRDGVEVPVTARAKPVFDRDTFIGFSGAMTFDQALLRDSVGRAA